MILMRAVVGRNVGTVTPPYPNDLARRLGRASHKLARENLSLFLLQTTRLLLVLHKECVQCRHRRRLNLPRPLIEYQASSGPGPPERP